MKNMQSKETGMTAEELRQQIAEIENANRAGAEAGAGSCPPLVTEEWKPAVSKAMNLLLYKPRTEKELKERLLQNGYEVDAVNFALQYVSYYGYLNDWKYAESYVMSNGNRKSRGVLRAELTGKGVGEAAIEAALELLETDERELAEELLRKRYGDPHEFDEKELRRAVGFLGRKGFSSSLVWSVIRDYQKSSLPD
ncbi:MAG: recombination regulator RecX [Lachnospiraceae bacterium]|nr:recombination regulator RecX [Lachnospiraceae bacterium]